MSNQPPNGSKIDFKPVGREDCNSRYGRLEFSSELGLHWPKAQDWVKPWQVPDFAKLVLGGTSKPVYRIFCNTDIHEPLTRVFDELLRGHLIHELKTFDGCFNVRWVRGVEGVASMHSWAIALDFNASSNALGQKVPGFSSDFLQIWRGAGWTVGADFHRPDPMHFEWTGPQG